MSFLPQLDKLNQSVVRHYKLLSALSWVMVTVGLAVSNQVYASPREPGKSLLPPESVTEGFSITDIGQFIAAILTLIFIIAGVLVFVYIVWGGIQWLTSGGDSGKAEEARNRITAALIGLAIIAIAYALVRLISYFFGVEIIGDKPIPKPFGGGVGLPPTCNNPPC